MSVELNNNYHPKIADHIDARLSSVSTAANLPDPTVASNFLYLGAIAFVEDEDLHYKIIDDGGWQWVPFETASLQIGTINITAPTSTLDLSLVTPAIEDCYAVQVNITSGTSATIQEITNWPITADKQITFYVDAGYGLTFSHTDYDSAVSGQIVLENGFDMTLTGRTIGNESLTLKKHGTALCQWDATQFMKSSEWVQNLLSIVVEDSLTSTSTTTALSANQGNVLNTLIGTKQQQLVAGIKMQLVPGISTTTINNLPRNWSVAYNGTGSIASPSAALAAAYTIISATPVTNDYRVADLRGFSNGVNAGVWIIPPGVDSSVIGNWISLSGTMRDELIRNYYSIADASPATGLITNVYYPKFSSISVAGDSSIPGVGFGTGWPANEFASVQFTEPGIYTMTWNAHVQVGAAAGARRFLGAITMTNGAQSIANPVLGGTVIKEEHFLNPSGESFAVKMGITMSYTFQTDGVTNNAFVLGISETANNWASCSVLNTGDLTIEKHDR